MVTGCVLLLTILAAVGCSAGTAVGAVDVPPTLPARPTPNSVGSFPCPHDPVSTLDIEACQARQLLGLGREFNQSTALLWSVLETSGRRAFARAQGAWLSYRDQECRARARAYVGGSAAPVEFGACEIQLTRARLTDVKAAIALYCQGKAGVGRHRTCPRP
jgi:uncharacterized protein YecT (DUF1311 family)